MWHGCQNRESIGQLISVLHGRSDIVRAISVYDENNRLLSPPIFILIPHQCSSAATSRQLTVTRDSDVIDPPARRIVLKVTPPTESPSSDAKNSQNMLGYIALELNLKSVRSSNIKKSLFPA
ncbi:hypothetical protein ACNKHM_19025 [Shigella sonnei]